MNKRYYTAHAKFIDTEITEAVLTVKAENKSSAEVIAENFIAKHFPMLKYKLKVTSGKSCKGCSYAKEEK